MSERERESLSERKCVVGSDRDGGLAGWRAEGTDEGDLTRPELSSAILSHFPLYQTYWHPKKQNARTKCSLLLFCRS